MKYSVETTENGYVETLELNGVEYHKRWTRTTTGESCEDAEFWEQLEADGIDNEDILDMVRDEIDNDFFASDFDRIYTDTMI